MITVAEAKTQVPSLSGVGDDALLTTLIAEAAEMMAAECAYPGQIPTMEDTTYTLYQDGPGGRELRLEVFPLVSITSITDDPDCNFTDASRLVAAGDYAIVKADSGLVRLTSSSAHGCWSMTPGAIKAVYVAGFATIPPKLKRLCAIQARHLYDLRVIQGKASVTQQGNSVAYRGVISDPTLLAPEVTQGLGFYHLPRKYGC